MLNKQASKNVGRRETVKTSLRFVSSSSEKQPDIRLRHATARTRGLAHLTPDNDLFLHLSSLYAAAHGSMANGTQCYRRARDDSGTENGAAWSSRHSRGGQCC